MPARTARPIHDANFLIQNLKKGGVEWPEGLDPYMFYAVICNIWNSKDQDYSSHRFDDKSIRLFKEYQDAKDCFDQCRYMDYMQAAGPDIDVELLQFSRGSGRVFNSRILFS